MTKFHELKLNAMFIIPNQLGTARLYRKETVSKAGIELVDGKKPATYMYESISPHQNVAETTPEEYMASLPEWLK